MSLSPGQDVRVSGASGGVARVIYVRGNSVRVRMAVTGRERTVELDRVTAAPVSKSLSVGIPEALGIDRRYGKSDGVVEGVVRRDNPLHPLHGLRPVPKPVTLTSPAYLAYVRKHPCCLCGAPGPSEAHHWSHHGGVMGAKVDDYRTVPLCQEHHRYWHDHGTLPGRTRAGSENLFKYHQRRLLVEWDVTIDDGDMIDALIRAIGGAHG